MRIALYVKSSVMNDVCALAWLTLLSAKFRFLVDVFFKSTCQIWDCILKQNQESSR
jgi:hypothetical protein